MKTVIQGSTLETLRAGLRGTAHAPARNVSSVEPWITVSTLFSPL